MSRASFRVAYDGEALASHTMDVRDLAPALMGLGEIFVEANRVLNGKEVKVEVHVTPQIEENCFDIGLEVIQTWGAIKELLGIKDIAAAKELVEWILLPQNLIQGTGAGWALVWLYKKIRGKKPVNVIRFNDENGNTLYRYQFDDQPDEIVDEHIHKLYQNNKIRTQLGRLLRPLTLRKGISQFTAYEPGAKDRGTRITKEEATSIDFTVSEPEPKAASETDDEPVEAVLRVYSPVYDPSAPRWRFWYGKEHHYMDVSESNIRDVVLENGGALIDDKFRVLLQISERETDSGETTTEYKVLNVLEFVPAFRQPDMFSNGEDDT